MTAPAPSTDDLILEAIDALEGAQKTLQKLSSPEFRKTVEDVETALREAQDDVLTLQMAKLRLRARLSHDPDKTPARSPSASVFRNAQKPPGG